MLELPGVPVPATAMTHELRISGYADDTALYVRHPRDATTYVELLELFGAAPGLRVNFYKSAGLWLGDHQGDTVEGIPMLAALATCRYLGTRVGMEKTEEANWAACTTALSARLRVADVETLTTIQRTSLVRAVIIPKIHFRCEKHSWPSRDTVAALQLFVRSSGWGATTTGIGERGCRLSRANLGFGRVTS